MNQRHTTLAALALTLTLATSAYGQGLVIVNNTDRFGWSENTGWIGFGNTPGSPRSGVYRKDGYLAGFAWSENLGWINFGDGSPTNGVAYANVNGLDFGVNVDASNRLVGFAWSENAGWINLDGGGLASPANAARFDPSTRRLRGFAWTENVGWINLDDPTRFVRFRCAADTNGDGVVNVADIFEYLNAWFAQESSADLTFDGLVTAADIFEFLNSWFAGC